MENRFALPAGSPFHRRFIRSTDSRMTLALLGEVVDPSRPVSPFASGDLLNAANRYRP